MRVAGGNLVCAVNRLLEQTADLQKETVSFPFVTPSLRDERDGFYSLATKNILCTLLVFDVVIRGLTHAHLLTISFNCRDRACAVNTVGLSGGETS